MIRSIVWTCMAVAIERRCGRHSAMEAESDLLAWGRIELGDGHEQVAKPKASNKP
jgi:hypothetical protein